MVAYMRPDPLVQICVCADLNCGFTFGKRDKKDLHRKGKGRWTWGETKEGRKGSLVETKPGTRLTKSRAGGQGPYLRSPDHLGRSSEVKEIKS